MFEKSTAQEERLDHSNVTRRDPRDGGRDQLGRDNNDDDGLVGTRLQGRRETTVAGLTAVGMHQLVELGRSRESQRQQKPCSHGADEREAGMGEVAGSRRHHGLIPTRSRPDAEPTTRRGLRDAKPPAPSHRNWRCSGPGWCATIAPADARRDNAKPSILRPLSKISIANVVS